MKGLLRRWIRGGFSFSAIPFEESLGAKRSRFFAARRGRRALQAVEVAAEHRKKDGRLLRQAPVPFGRSEAVVCGTDIFHMGSAVGTVIYIQNFI